ncbi:MAG: 3-oxoacyl-ACP reductase FabG [Peptococcaceae bacterium]|nr:3-oxoacyl-ACP reductase FabG [Peptococcaceae bacterium]
MSHIVITGGSRGIGAAMVRRFARDGHHVVFLYKAQIEKARALVRMLQAEGRDATGIQCDVADPAAVSDVFAAIKERWNHVDVLINCAGISKNGLLQDMLPQEWQSLMATNVDSVFYCSRAVLPEMIARKQGVIINLSSIWGARPAACEVAYSTSKGAIDAFTRSLAAELSYSGIRVNAIAPGVVHTDMVSALGDDTLKSLSEEMPMGRFATPDEIADLAAYLASDKAAYITGQILTIAGGFAM